MSSMAVAHPPRNLITMLCYSVIRIANHLGEDQQFLNYKRQRSKKSSFLLVAVTGKD